MTLRDGMSKKTTFQIAGLPRSGTAWITAVLNLCPSVICVHEAIDKNVPVPKNEYSSVGESGSHLLLPDFVNKKVDFRLFIYRDYSDSYDSLCKATDTDIPIDWWNEFLTPLAREFFNKSDMVIEFESLFTIEGIKKIWSKVTKDPFEEDKISLMLGMNVQRNLLEYDLEEKFIEMFNNHQNEKREVA